LALGASGLLSAPLELLQRKLSPALGFNLGRTHYVLHGLPDKGQVKFRSTRRNDNELVFA
jgi:hypothetical protein